MARTVDFRIIPIKASFDRAVPKPAPAIQVPNLQVAAAEGRESTVRGASGARRLPITVRAKQVQEHELRSLKQPFTRSKRALLGEALHVNGLPSFPGIPLPLPSAIFATTDRGTAACQAFTKGKDKISLIEVMGAYYARPLERSGALSK